MHLEDFNTAQNEIEVYCGKHIPPDRKNGLVWLYGDKKADKKAFVRWLTDNARDNSGGNHPNYREADVENIPDGALAVGKERLCSGMVPGHKLVVSKRGHTSKKR